MHTLFIDALNEPEMKCTDRVGAGSVQWEIRPQYRRVFTRFQVFLWSINTNYTSLPVLVRYPRVLLLPALPNTLTFTTIYRKERTRK